MRLLAILTFLCCVSSATRSQIRFGVSSGLNVANLYNEKNDVSEQMDDYYDIKLGVAFYFFAEHSFNERIGLQMDVGYSQAGAKFAYFTKEPVYVQYLSVPIVFFYKPIKQLKLSAGPELNYLLSLRTDLKSSMGSVEDKFESIDYGLKAGIEYMPFPRWSIAAKNYFGLHYNGTYGYNLHNDPDFSTFKINRNNIFQVSLQYYFND